MLATIVWYTAVIIIFRSGVVLAHKQCVETKDWFLFILLRRVCCRKAVCDNVSVCNLFPLLLRTVFVLWAEP